jgi:AcrR family transcriptional regulator
MARRGDELREHILFAAKDVFLELGFERTSMDLVAARAETSKRSLYAHFESKDKLFQAVAELISGRYLDRLGTPGHYSGDTADAVALFCGRFLQLLLWGPALRACRLFIGEAGRLPDVSARYYGAIFETAHERLAAFLGERCSLDPAASTGIATELIGQVVYPRVVQALLGVEKLTDERPDEASLAADPGLEPIRAAVAALLPSGAVNAP